MPKKSTPKPPKHLSRTAKTWWLEMQTAYEIEDAGGIAMLTQAAEAQDRITQAREQISKDGIVTMDRFGQKQPHPATRVLAAAEATVRGALRLLNLDPTPRAK